MATRGNPAWLIVPILSVIAVTALILAITMSVGRLANQIATIVFVVCAAGAIATLVTTRRRHA